MSRLALNHSPPLPTTTPALLLPCLPLATLLALAQHLPPAKPCLFQTPAPSPDPGSLFPAPGFLTSSRGQPGFLSHSTLRLLTLSLLILFISYSANPSVPAPACLPLSPFKPFTSQPRRRPPRQNAASARRDSRLRCRRPPSPPPNICANSQPLRPLTPPGPPPRPLRRPSAPFPAPSPLYLPPSSARASCHPGARRAGGPRPLSPIGPPVRAPPPGPAMRQRRTFPAATWGPAPFTQVCAVGTKFRVSGCGGPV